MIRAVLRSCAAAGAVVVLAFAADWATFAAFCELHASARRGPGHAITVRDFAIPRPGDKVLACTTRHCFGVFERALGCHDDLSCYCTPAATSTADLERRLGPSQCRPAGADCPPGHCRLHVDP